MLPPFSTHKLRAKKVIIDRVRYFAKIYNLKYRRVAIKDLSSRWGSCSAKKNLNFHYGLAFLSPEILDYVVVHELCHLVHLNHSRAFWKLVAQTTPDFRQRILALRQVERELKKARQLTKRGFFGRVLGFKPRYPSARQD